MGAFGSCAIAAPIQQSHSKPNLHVVVCPRLTATPPRARKSQHVSAIPRGISTTNNRLEPSGFNLASLFRIALPLNPPYYLREDNQFSAMEAEHQQLPPEATGIPEPVTVATTLSPSRIQLSLTASDRDGVLRELVSLVIPPQERRNAELLFEALKAREDLCSTCVNEGVAIPHSRNALVGLVEKPFLAYGRHPRGIQFGALDGKPVRHFFLLCAPNVREHLQLLAQLARLVHNAEFRAQLAAAKRSEDVIAVARNAEQALGGG